MVIFVLRNHFELLVTNDLTICQLNLFEMLNHFHQHESFVNFIKQRKKENEAGDVMAAFHLAQDLKTWLLSHIAHEDKKMALFLKERMKDVNEFIRKIHHNGEITVESGQRNFYKKITKS